MIEDTCSRMNYIILLYVVKMPCIESELEVLGSRQYEGGIVGGIKK